MLTRSIQEEVFSFVATFCAVPVNSLTPDTTLVGDLGIDGDDGEDLVSAFVDRFEVDWGDFHFENHFGSEGLPLRAPLFWIYLGIAALLDRSSTPESRAGLSPIRIQDLIDSAQSGRWTTQRLTSKYFTSP